MVTVAKQTKPLLLLQLHQHVNMDLSEIEVKGIVKETISNLWSNSMEMTERARQKGQQYASAWLTIVNEERQQAASCTNN